MLKYLVIVLLATAVVVVGATMKQHENDTGTVQIYNATTGQTETVDKVVKTDDQWKAQLTPEQYRITRLKGTEAPHSGTCSLPTGVHNGIFQCVCCGTDLFKSGSKFESGTGWPSFWDPVSPLNIRLEPDESLGRLRTEAMCARCGAHLGHVFDDGPPPTGKRYCINSVAIKSSESRHEQAYETATFAAGCFWGVESAFRKLMDKGVISTQVGYTGGHTSNPTYQDVCSHQTGHAESVEVKFDPSKISYKQLLNIFWSIHDPTTANRQGPDIGSQYRSAIFYHTPKQRELAEESKRELEESKTLRAPVVTEVTQATKFYAAEDYHQQYLEKKGIEPTCHVL